MMEHYKKIKGKLIRVYPKPAHISKEKERKINAICKEVLKEIKPRPEDTAYMLIEVCKVIKVIKDGLGKDVNCVLGGSVGKGTDLR